MDSFRHRADVSGVFARNLQLLVADQPSISAACRALEINRTQFNRYLSGEAHPRPEVLAKICAYFECDARILLTPLAEIDALLRRRLPAEIDPSPLLAQVLGFDHARMPDGLYRVLMPAFSSDQRIFSTLIELFTLATGGKGLRWSVPLYAALPTGKPVGWRDRKQIGMCLQQSDGVSMLMASHYTRLFLLYFVSPGYQGVTDLHVGYAALTQTRRPDQAPVQPLIIEKLGPGLGPALAKRRKGAFISFGEMSDLHQHYFETWHPGWTPR